MKDWGQNFIQQYWAGGLDKRLPVIAALVCIVLLTHSVAVLTWKFVPVPKNSPFPENLRQSNHVANSHPRGESMDQPAAAKISQLHLFGKYEVKTVAPPPKLDVASAPETRLNLKLRGVFSSQDKTIARAIISDPRGNDDSYAIGDQVPGGAVLNDILVDRVILEHNGQLEILKLPVEALPDDNATAMNSRSSAASRYSGRRAPSPPINTATADTSQILRHYRDALLNDPQSVMGLVRVQPYSRGGKLEGYRIRPGRDRRLLSRFGLRSGDVVKAVNGVPMNNPIKALEILRDLSTANSVTLDIERNGRPQSFTFQIK